MDDGKKYTNFPFYQKGYSWQHTNIQFHLLNISQLILKLTIFEVPQ
jgi:hypothetical protein